MHRWNGRERRRSGTQAAVLAASVLGLVLLGAGRLAAQEYTFTASLAGTIGGALDVDGADPGFDQTGFQLGFAWNTGNATQVGVRLGRVDFSGEVLDGPLFDPELDYVTIGGEYRHRESYYTSGLFLGLGLYRLDGTLASGEKDDPTAIGLTLGATGEFPFNERFAFLAELTGHYADFDHGTRIYAFLHLGLAYHF